MNRFLFGALCFACCASFALCLWFASQDERYYEWQRVAAIVFATTAISAVVFRIFGLDKQRSRRREFRYHGPRGFYND